MKKKRSRNTAVYIGVFFFFQRWGHTSSHLAIKFLEFVLSTFLKPMQVTLKVSRFVVRFIIVSIVFLSWTAGIIWRKASLLAQDQDKQSKMS